MEEIASSMDRGRYTCGISIDLKKAVHRTDDSTLLLKLRHYGVRGVAHEWIKNYVTRRYQYEYHDDVKSEEKHNMWCSTSVYTWTTVMSIIM